MADLRLRNDLSVDTEGTHKIMKGYHKIFVSADKIRTEGTDTTFASMPTSGLAAFSFVEISGPSLGCEGTDAFLGNRSAPSQEPHQDP